MSVLKTSTSVTALLADVRDFSGIFQDNFQDDPGHFLRDKHLVERKARSKSYVTTDNL